MRSTTAPLHTTNWQIQKKHAMICCRHKSLEWSSRRKWWTKSARLVERN
jgi:hypothetical protein